MSAGESAVGKQRYVRYAEDSVDHASSAESERDGSAFAPSEAPAKSGARFPHKPSLCMPCGDTPAGSEIAFRLEPQLYDDLSSPSLPKARSRAMSFRDAYHSTAEESERAPPWAFFGGPQPSAASCVRVSQCAPRWALRASQHTVSASFAASDRTVLDLAASSERMGPLGEARGCGGRRSREGRKGVVAMYLSSRSRQMRNRKNSVRSSAVASSCPHVKRGGKVIKSGKISNSKDSESEKSIFVGAEMQRRARSCPPCIPCPLHEVRDGEVVRAAASLQSDRWPSRMSASVLPFGSSPSLASYETPQYRMAVQSARVGRYGLTIKEILADSNFVEEGEDEDEVDNEDDEYEAEDDDDVNELDADDEKQDHVVERCEY